MAGHYFFGQICKVSLKHFAMTLTIILFVLVIGGLVLIGYRMNKDKSSVNKDEAMKDGSHIRQEMRK